VSVTTIVVADDHRIVRQGVKMLLEKHADLQVVGEADDGLDTLRLVERLSPAILILDLAMPGLDGLDVIREVRRTTPSTAVVVLSMQSDDGYVREALGRGASAYVLKSSGAGELVEAIRQAARGRRYLSPPLSERAIDAYAPQSSTKPPDAYEALTTREREVLHLAAEGYANAEIGARLFISPRTVEIHRAKAMHKLGLQSYRELLHYALRRGMISSG
jgi:two-component system, NarL family, response regulator NreC